MESDRELLRRYAQNGDEAAFTEVVRRHTDLVYSAALRLAAGDAPLAQDIAQKVFATLAQKSAALAGRENLLGWLHTTTRYAASAAVRGERRRRTHEHEAGTTMHHDTAAPELDWSQLQPLLDEAVGRLRAPDREAVLLRFFQGKSHREVAAQLGLNEALARKRVERALEKMRAFLARRGVRTSAALLAVAIATNSVQAAPTGLAATLTVGPLAQAVHVAAARGILQGITMTSKTKITLAAAAALAIALIPITLQSMQIRHQVEADDNLAKQNVLLQSEEAQLSLQLGNARRQPQNAFGKTPLNTGYIPVSWDFLKNIPGFGLGIQNYTLMKDGGVMLGLTPNESDKVQSILSQVKTRVQAYEKASVREISMDQIKDVSTLDFLQENPGKQTAYEIPPMSEDALAAYTKWFSDNLTEAIGAERAAAVLGVMQGKGEVSSNIYDDLWLKPHLSYHLVFSDYKGADGKPATAWLVTSEDDTGGGGGGQSNDPNAIPPEWTFLFKEVGEFQPPTK